MDIGINSLSSSLMLGTTLYRNQPGLSNKIIAQAGYALIALVAAVETVVALTFLALSLVAYSPTSFEHSTQWLSSSVFSFGWSAADFFLNPFVIRLVADEKSARRILQSGDFMMVPHGAVI